MRASYLNLARRVDRRAAIEAELHESDDSGSKFAVFGMNAGTVEDYYKGLYERIGERLLGLVGCTREFQRPKKPSLQCALKPGCEGLACTCFLKLDSRRGLGQARPIHIFGTG